LDWCDLFNLFGFAPSGRLLLPAAVGWYLSFLQRLRVGLRLALALLNLLAAEALAANSAT
jgi:hypothetical protein